MSLLALRNRLWQSQLTNAASSCQKCVLRYQSSNTDKAWAAVIPQQEVRQPKTSEPETPEQRWTAASFDFLRKNQHKPADAYTGRSVKVENGDINKANRYLSGILARDGVMKEWFENRRHRQKGELRRKLASMRWRRLFKHEVGKKVELVQQIRRRGA